MRLISHPQWLRKATEITLSSKGANTPGMDGVIKVHLQEGLNDYLTVIRTDLLSGNYQPLPARRLCIQKARRDRDPWNHSSKIGRKIAIEESRPWEPVVVYCHYADDFVVIVKGTKQEAKAVRDQCREFLETGALVALGRIAVISGHYS